MRIFDTLLSSPNQNFIDALVANELGLSVRILFVPAYLLRFPGNFFKKLSEWETVL